MYPLISLTAILPVIVFYLWMFRDMTNNDDLPASAKYNWTLALIFLNVAAAIFYFIEYRYRP